MFDFEKLEVYQLMKDQHNKVMLMLRQDDQMDRQIHDHWKNSMLLAVMNLVQASARVNTVEKKDLITISRGYIFECSSLLDLVKSTNGITPVTYQELYDNYERISKMLLGMYKSFNGKIE
jgi:four helix bundle protein